MINTKCISCGFEGLFPVTDEREYYSEDAFGGTMSSECPECGFAFLVNPFLVPDKIIRKIAA